MSNYDFIVFDYDGVIIDSLPAVSEAVVQLHAKFGFPAPRPGLAASFIGPSIAESIARTRETFGIGGEEQESMEQYYFEAYVSCAADLTVSFPGMLDLLHELAMREVPRALATMKAQSEFDAIGVDLPGTQYFDFVASPPNHLGGHSKTQLVENAIAYIQRVTPAAQKGLIIGDRASDIRAGTANGLQTVAVLWGFGSPDELAEADPDHTVSTVDELRELLLGA